MFHRTRRRAQGFALLAAAAALLAGRAQQASAEKSPLKQCTDAAWAEYNECLMESSSSFFRRGCDYDFMMSYEKCQIVHWRETLGLS